MGGFRVRGHFVLVTLEINSYNLKLNTKRVNCGIINSTKQIITLVDVPNAFSLFKAKKDICMTCTLVIIIFLFIFTLKKYHFIMTSSLY